MNSGASTSSCPPVFGIRSPSGTAPLPTSNKHVLSSRQDASSSSRQEFKNQPMTFGQAQKEIESAIQTLNVKQLRRFAKNKKICLFSATRKSEIQSWILSHLQFELHKCYLGVLVQHHKSIAKPIAKSRK